MNIYGIIYENLTREERINLRKLYRVCQQEREFPIPQMPSRWTPKMAHDFVRDIAAHLNRRRA